MVSEIDREEYIAQMYSATLETNQVSCYSDRASGFYNEVLDFDRQAENNGKIRYSLFFLLGV